MIIVAVTLRASGDDRRGSYFSHTPEIQINVLYKKICMNKYFENKKYRSKTSIASTRLCVLVVMVTVVGCSAVQRRTRNRESPCLNPPFVTISKFGHLHSLHDASVRSAV